MPVLKNTNYEILMISSTNYFVKKATGNEGSENLEVQITVEDPRLQRMKMMKARSELLEAIITLVLQKNLPGVKELLKPKKRDVTRRTRHELYQRIDADYYGYRDDEDGLLEKLEAEAEQKAREVAIEEWNVIATEKWGDLDLAPNVPNKNNKTEDLKVYIALPTQEEIDEAILRKRKEEVMKKYLV